MSYSDFRTELMKLSDDNYRDFIMRGILCDRPFLGVRVPEIRQLVNKIPPENFTEFLNTEPLAYEEVIARGLLIARLPYSEMLKVFNSQIAYLDNWSTVDTFCASLRSLLKHHESEFLELKIEPLLKSKNEFAVRAGLVFLLDHYVTSDYLHLIFDRVEFLKHRDEYYIKMATSWLLAECFIEFPEITIDYLKNSKLPVWTFNKAISKICDSHRVDEDAKSMLKTLRKKSQ